MKKLLLCLVIGLSAAMLFAVDITSDLTGNSWNNNGDFKVTFDLDESSLNYVKVGFSGSQITTDTTGPVNDISTAAIDSTETNGKFSLKSSNQVWVYYQIKSSSDVTLTLSAENLKADAENNEAAENAKEIPFHIGVTPVGTDPATPTTINSNTKLDSATPVDVLKYTSETSAAAESVQLDIYTTLDDIPVGADGAYTGKIKLSVTTSG